MLLCLALLQHEMPIVQRRLLGDLVLRLAGAGNPSGLHGQGFANALSPGAEDLQTKALAWLRRTRLL